MRCKLLKGAASPANCARKIAGPLMVLMVSSTPPSIYDKVLCRAFFRRFRTQEESHILDIARNYPRLQTLPGHDFLLELRRIPHFDLPLRPDGPGRERVDPYPERAKFASQNPRQHGDGSLGHVVHGNACELE